VGRNLHDHPALTIFYSGTPRLLAAMQAFVEAGGWLYEEQTIAKARSSLCRGAFDLHLYPVGSPYWNSDGSWLFMIPVATMTPMSRGLLRLASRDPAAAPTIDHGYLTDPEDRDLAVLLDGIDVARTLAAQPPLADLVGLESVPGVALRERNALCAHVRVTSGHYFHPVGTCKMGPAADPLSVVDACGRLHGVEGAVVADASIMPVIPRANTNIPCAVVGEKIATVLLESEANGDRIL
jgi:choline dehydrogenase